MPDCLDENTVIEFIQGLLPPETVKRIEDHVDACRDCRLLLGEVAKLSFAGGSSRRSHDTLPAAGSDPTATLPPLETDRSGDAVGEGQVLAGRFRIVRRLGRGSFGAVYEAEDLQLQEHVALKLLRPEVRAVPSLLKHLHHEIVVGRRISHPNVCRIFDLGTYGDTHFISMELVRGESLDQVLARGAPPRSTTVAILRQIAGALEAAHAQGVVHRDLKPGNIMIDERGKLTVMDFGLARDLRAMPSMSGALIGSPAYWSPEQARGDRATERSDIYTFGLIACDLFGVPRPGFGEETKSRYLGPVPQPFRAIVERCLRPRPEERFGSAQELVVALRRAERGGSASTSRPLLAALVGAGCAVALGVVALVVYLVTRPPVGPVAVSPTAAADARAPASRPVARPVVDARLTVAAAPDVESADPANRRPRPGKRKVTAKVDAPPPPATPDARVVVAPPRLSPTHKERLARLEADRKKRGLFLDDVPELRARVEDARRACAGTDDKRAAEALSRLEDTLRRAKIDETFVKRKLERLNKLKESLRPDEARAKQVAEIFAKVHKRFFAGDFVAANDHLNQILRLLGRGE
jgi:hypothetical protein